MTVSVSVPWTGHLHGFRSFAVVDSAPGKGLVPVPGMASLGHRDAACNLPDGTTGFQRDSETTPLGLGLEPTGGDSNQPKPRLELEPTVF